MSASMSSSTTSTQQPGKTVNASAQASTPQQKTVIVSGEQGDSVNVQSQLATSHVAGDVTSKSNIGQVIGDLGTAHNSSSQWLDAETAKVSQWGQSEIQRVLAQTKAMEEALVTGAKEKQKALDASHSGELAKLVQEMDLRKAAELKELEDGLQRQIQATLSSSKQDINRVESEMNAKKMELLKQSQLKSAKEIDQLSNLVVETKLVPSQTRTVIETNTNTGNVMAVATGGQISTGSAQAESYSSAKIAAIPNAGELRQASDVVTGDMVRDADGRKVGEGAIVNTMTAVQEQKPLAAGQSGNVTIAARPLQADQTQPIAHRQQPAAPATGVAGQHTPLQDKVIHDAATHGTKGLHHVAAPQAGLTEGVKQAYLADHQGVKHDGAAVPMQQQQPIAGHAPLLNDARSRDAKPLEQSHALEHGTGAVDGVEHKHGLLCKVKHALGMAGDKDAKHAHDGHMAGEPRSTDATKRVV